MSARLEEMLMIAQAATKGPWYFSFSDNATPHILTENVDLRSEYDDNEVVKILVHTVPDTLGKQYENGIFAATFNPRTAEALVKVALAAEASARKRATWRRFRGVDASHDDWPKQVEDADQAMIEALFALTAAMEDSNVG